MIRGGTPVLPASRASPSRNAAWLVPPIARRGAPGQLAARGIRSAAATVRQIANCISSALAHASRVASAGDGFLVPRFSRRCRRRGPRARGVERRWKQRPHPLGVAAGFWRLGCEVVVDRTHARSPSLPSASSSPRRGKELSGYPGFQGIKLARPGYQGAGRRTILQGSVRSPAPLTRVQEVAGSSRWLHRAVAAKRTVSAVRLTASHRR